MISQANNAADFDRARERFRPGDSRDSGRTVGPEMLRPSVLDSWHRSQLLQVDPDRVELPYVREPNPASRLARAAGPVLQRVTDDLAAQAVSVVLTATDGVVIERNAAQTSILDALDGVSLAPGYSLAEEVAGTNGIGTALETGKPAFVGGGEHYVTMFTGFACAGAPIRDPLTHRMIGAVNLSCLANQSDPLLLALAASAGRQIEDRMRSVAHAHETALLEAYLQQSRRSSSGVLAIGGDVVLLNPYLRRMLDGHEQAALVEHASELVSTKLSGSSLVVLPTGNTAKIALVDRSTFDGRRTNVVFQVDVTARSPAPRPPRSDRPPSPIPGLAGRSSAWLRCCEQVHRHCRDQDWVLIEGEKGSGRSRLAQAVGRHVKPDRAVRILRAETFPNTASFIAELAAISSDDGFALVIADADDLDADAVGPVASVLACRTGRGWVAVTGSSETPVGEALLSLFPRTVTVPPLRHRIDDLEQLVPVLLRELTRGADVTLTPEAMRQLSRLPWPGNVAQLRRVLSETVMRQRTGVIGVDALPPECHSATRRKLTQLEALERDAIIRSLRDNDGRKPEAARALGMSRATIYRKISYYGIG